jgi:hypothetical protein
MAIADWRFTIVVGIINERKTIGQMRWGEILKDIKKVVEFIT